MHWQDDYLDYSYDPVRPGVERLRLQAYVDGRLVDSWTEPVRGSRWERFADQFDGERPPAVHRPPEPPRHEQVLRWLDGVVGGRAALLALTAEAGDQVPAPYLPDTESEVAYVAVREALAPVADEFLDAEARRVLDRSLALLWEAAPHAVTGARSAKTVAGGLLWIVGKANGLFDGGFTQQLVRRELWLKQGLNVPGQALARHLRGLDFHGARRPHGCPDLASFARPELLTVETRRTLVQWRDLALALEPATVLPPEVASPGA
ncbi:MAG: hypothetical protein ACXWDM_10890 [Nocardioides sp.]